MRFFYLIVNKIKLIFIHGQKAFNDLSPETKREWLKRFILILLILFFLSRFYPFFLPPKILSTIPYHSMSNVPLDSKIEIIFSEPMVKFLVEKSFNISPKIKGSFVWEGGQKLIFIPQEKLKFKTEYTINFLFPLFSKRSIPLLSLPKIKFETQGNPEVILSSPQGEIFNYQTPIIVVFDRPMIRLTTATESDKISPIKIKPDVKGDGRWLSTSVFRFLPSEPYKKGMDYQVIVPSGLFSVDGGKLNKDYIFRFSTEGLKVLEINPARDYSYASPFTAIVARFNQEIEEKSALGRFKLYDKNNKEVQGRLVVKGNELSFYPRALLKRGEKFMVRIDKKIRPIAGNKEMEKDFIWYFKVGPKPEIIKTTPFNDQENVSEDFKISIYFNSPMDRDSFENNILIDPNPKEKPEFFFSSYEDNHILTIYTHLQRGKKYSVTISPDVKDQHGEFLGKKYQFSFTTSRVKPSIGIFPPETYFAVFNQKIIPRIIAQVTNSRKIEYNLYRLNKEDFIDLYRRRYGNFCSNENCRKWQDYDFSKLERIHSWKEEFEVVEDTPTRVITKVTNSSGENLPSGFYFLDLKIDEGVHDNIVLILTQSVLTFKKSPNQFFVWATNQSTGEVIPEMEVELIDINGKSLLLGNTNKDGVFIDNKIRFSKEEYFWLVFGKKGNEQTVISNIWDDGIESYDFGLPYYREEQLTWVDDDNKKFKIFIALDRPIYRPGQKIYFKGIVRKDLDGQYETFSGKEKVSVEIINSQGRLIFSRNFETNLFGSFFGEFNLGKEISVGYYQIKASIKDNIYKQQFQVEEYRKQDLMIEVKPDKERYLDREIAQITINASYFFGASANNLPLRWFVDRQNYFFNWEKDQSFNFGEEEYWWEKTENSDNLSKKKSEGKGETNIKGEYFFYLPFNLSNEKNSQRIIIEAVVNDVNNQEVAGSTYFNVHKARYYVGLRPESYSNSIDQEIKVGVVTVDFQGKEESGHSVRVNIYRRTWETIREKNPDDGRFYYRNKAIDSLKESKELITDNFGRSSIVFIPDEGGTYKIEALVKDESGNENRTVSYLWVAGRGFSSVRENNDRILIKPDKNQYQVGEEMRLFVATPFASDSAKTLLTFERSRVLDYRVVDTSDTNNNFILSIDSKYIPNVFVSALLIRPGDVLKKPAEFKMGYTEVKILDKKNQIRVNLKTNKEKYKPKETVNLEITTNDANGNPIESEIALAFVDKAIFDLSSIQPPDLYQVFYQPRNLMVETSHLLTISFDRINANTDLGAKGGSGGGGGGGVNTSRKKFLDTAFWSPNIQTNNKGKASLKITVPDNLTTWTIVALANSKEAAFGSLKKEIKVSQDILIRPFIPRFLSFGDQANLGAIVVNNSGIDRTLKLVINSDNLEIKEEKEKNFSLKDAQQVKNVWSVEVKNKENTKINLKLIDDQNKKLDEIEVTIPTKSFSVPETMTAAGEVKGTALEKIFLPKNIDHSLGNLTISLSTVFGIKGLKTLNHLYYYPYDCNEQLASKFLGTLYVYRIMNRLKIDKIYSFDKKTIEKNLFEGNQRIISQQNIDGGWGWWSKDNSDLRLTSYIYYALTEAKKEKLSIDQKIIDKAENFLLERLMKGKSLSTNLTLSDKVYLLYVLKESRKKLSSFVEDLFDRRFELSYGKRAELGAASLLIEKKDTKAKRIYKELITVAKKTGVTTHWEESRDNEYFGGSAIETTAAIFELIYSLDKNSPLIHDVLRYFLMVQKEDYQTTTFENRAIIKSFSDYLADKNNLKIKTQRYQLLLNQKEIDQGEIMPSDWQEEIKKVIPISQIKVGVDNTLKINKINEGDLFYHLNVKYYLPVEEIGPLERGLIVTREFFDNQGKIITNNKIKENDDLSIKLTLIVPESRYYLVLEDFLPAGLEAVNNSLKNVGVLNRRTSIKEKDINQFYYFKHQEFRDDRVAFFASYLPAGIYELTYQARATTPGKYHHPPALSYQMYVPSIFGRSNGGWFVVE